MVSIQALHSGKPWGNTGFFEKKQELFQHGKFGMTHVLSFTI
jgi:hypothetical protein